MENKQIRGIHHMTAIAGNPQQNLDFYTGVLGLRLVKLTVNFDDPGTYHFYFGDELGRPGSILTFFPWPGAQRGRPGNGQIASISFAISDGALTYWQARLARFGVSTRGPVRRFDDHALTFFDPDGLQLELVTSAAAQTGTPWEGSPVPAEYGMRGLHSISMWEQEYEPTAALLTETLGFRFVGQEGSRYRFQAAAGELASILDVEHRPDGEQAWNGAGTVHHVAWRTPGDEEQLAWRQVLINRGTQVTPVMDRQYFHSIYFREPGGVLFEIATDPPGFTLDESPEQLGQQLRLPPWLESRREEIERRLPELNLEKISVP